MRSTPAVAVVVAAVPVPVSAVAGGWVGSLVSVVGVGMVASAAADAAAAANASAPAAAATLPTSARRACRRSGGRSGGHPPHQRTSCVSAQRQQERRLPTPTCRPSGRCDTQGRHGELGGGPHSREWGAHTQRRRRWQGGLDRGVDGRRGGGGVGSGGGGGGGAAAAADGGGGATAGVCPPPRPPPLAVMAQLVLRTLPRGTGRAPRRQRSPAAARRSRASARPTHRPCPSHPPRPTRRGRRLQTPRSRSCPRFPRSRQTFPPWPFPVLRSPSSAHSFRRSSRVCPLSGHGPCHRGHLIWARWWPPARAPRQSVTLDFPGAARRW